VLSISRRLFFFSVNNSIGRFLLGILSDLLKWHQDEQLYLQENRTKSGGKAAYLPGLQLRWTNKPTVSIGDLAKWSEIHQFNRKCHRKLAKVCALQINPPRIPLTLLTSVLLIVLKRANLCTSTIRLLS
jgi:Transcription factor/nuclear export subunit protein 2